MAVHMRDQEEGQVTGFQCITDTSLRCSCLYQILKEDGYTKEFGKCLEKQKGLLMWDSPL